MKSPQNLKPIKERLMMTSHHNLPQEGCSCSLCESAKRIDGALGKVKDVELAMNLLQEVEKSAFRFVADDSGSSASVKDAMRFCADYGFEYDGIAIDCNGTLCHTIIAGVSKSAMSHGEALEWVENLGKEFSLPSPREMSVISANSRRLLYDEDGIRNKYWTSYYAGDGDHSALVVNTNNGKISIKPVERFYHAAAILRLAVEI